MSRRRGRPRRRHLHLPARRALAWLAAFGLGLALAACATTGRGAGRGPADPVAPVVLSAHAAQGWQALAKAEAARAAQAFAQAGQSTPDDVPAQFGRITLAWEGGQNHAAVLESLALLEQVGQRLAPSAAGAGKPAPADRRLLALLADATAARLRELFDVVIDPRPLEDRLLRLPTAHLPWRARLAIEDAVDLVVRRRGDAVLLAGRGAASGCLTALDQVGVIGRLPHVDLTSAFTAPAPAMSGSLVASNLPPAANQSIALAPRSGERERERGPDSSAAAPHPGRRRPDLSPQAGRGEESVTPSYASRGGTGLRASGCRLWLPPRDGWPGVRVLRTVLPAARVPRLLVLDFAGPARVVLGGPAAKRADLRLHQPENIFGPRAGVTAVPASQVPVPIEVRLGTYGGAAELRLFVVEDNEYDDGAAGVAVAAGGDGVAAAPLVTAPVPAAAAALVDLATLLAADSAGQIDQALSAVARLAAQPRFAAGLAAAASFVALEPSRPSTLTQAEGDGLLRRALGANRAAEPAAADKSLVRVLAALAASELGHGRGSEAAGLAEQALVANPTFWPAAVTLSEAQRSRGLERQADATVDRAVAALGEHGGGCPVVQLAYERARGRHHLDEEQALIARLSACDARLAPEVEWRMGRGESDLARASLARRGAVALDPSSFVTEAAALDLAVGRAQAAAARLDAAVPDRLRDPALRLRLADALVAAGDTARAEAILTDTVRWFPGDANIAKLARLRGLPLPMAAYHLDGRAVIADYRKDGREYAAPAVLVLDRTVMRVLGDGTTIVLTHNIVNVKTKDGITRWGEVAVPAGAEILVLRTHKADGSTREPEDIGGKDTVSAPDLAPGDFVEWETIEYRGPADGLAPGFLAERFYFQSVELPLHLSELLLAVPANLPLAIDARAGAPAPSETRAADGARVLRFTARHMPQLFTERAAVRPEEWIPSVRASAGLVPGGFVRNLRDNLFGVARSSPALRAEAQRIAAGAGSDRRAIAAAIVRWVMDHIEAEANVYESATASLARGRGNRAGVIVALARAAGLDAQLALARPLGTAPADAALVPQELDDFSDVLVRFAGLGGDTAPDYLDPRYEHAAFGYLPPGLDGAAVLVVDKGTREIARARQAGGDERRVQLDLRVDAAGQASGVVIETLRGWPAIEWASFAKQWGDDTRKLRQEFEQRWLGQHFPGARLGGLAIDIDRDRPGHARLRYSIVGLALGGGADAGVRIVLPFFRVSPGRRFATLPSRRTPLLLGPEVALSLVARITLPAGAQVSDVGRGGKVTDPINAGIAFQEQRQVLPPPNAGAGPVIELRRAAQLPLLRIEPAAYAALAPELRRIDALERAEIQYALPASPRAKPASRPNPTSGDAAVGASR